MFLLTRLEGFVKRNEKESERAGEKILLLIESSSTPEMTHEESLMSCHKTLCHISGRQIFFALAWYLSNWTQSVNHNIKWCSEILNCWPLRGESLQRYSTHVFSSKFCSSYRDFKSHTTLYLATVTLFLVLVHLFLWIVTIKLLLTTSYNSDFLTNYLTTYIRMLLLAK